MSKEAMNTTVETTLTPDPDTVGGDPAADIALPAPNRGKAATFSLLSAIASITNVVCGVFTYAIYSRGEILEELYDQLVATDTTMFVWIAAGIGLLGTVLTLISYIISFDFRRPSRPVIRLWILWTSFAVFLAGLLLGMADVSADNVPIILGSLVACFLLPLPVLLLEKGIGRGAISSAQKLLSSGSISSARASARTGLTFCPGNSEALVAYGRALSAAGKPLQALPYLLYIEQREVPLQPVTTLALADAWEAAGENQKTIDYLDKLSAEDVTPALLDRQVRLWLDAGYTDRATETIREMPLDQRRPWRERYQQLLYDRRDRKGLHTLCSEVCAEDEAPFDRTVGCLKDILSLYPSDTEALMALINLQKDLKQPQTVAALQEELLTLDEERVDVRRELIEFYWQNGSKPDLLRHLNRVMLSGKASTDEKVRLVEETYAEGDYLRIEQLVTEEADLANNPRALAILANALYQGDRPDAALERIAQARRLSPDDRLNQNLDALSAKIRNAKLTNELEDLRERTATAPQDLDVRFEYLDRLVASRGTDRVVVELDDMLRANPDLIDRVEKEIRVMLSRHGKNRRLMEYLGDLYLRHGEYDKAYEIYERRAQDEIDAAEILHDAVQRILTRKPDHAPSLLSEVEYYHHKEESAETLAHYDRLKSTGVGLDTDVRLLELEAAEKAGDLHRASDSAETLLADRPEDTAMLTRAGLLALQMKDYPRAISHFQKATDLEPDSFDHRRHLRTAVETMKRARIAEINEQLKSSPGNRDLLEELGDLHHDFDQLNEAIAYYQKAGINDPDRRVPKAKQGYVLAKKGLFTDADEILKEADLRADLPQDEQDRLKNLFFTAAQLMEQEDEYERALELYRRIFRVDAGYNDVVIHIERLQTSAKKKQSKY